MPTLNDVLRKMPHLRPAEVEWLHLLVGDWQLLSDLSFADLVLWVHGTTDDPTSWTVATHVRPNTGPLVFFEDIVGSVAGPGRRVLLEQCAMQHRIIRDTGAEWSEDMPVREEAIPVIRAGRVLAVITRHSNLGAIRTPSRLELTYKSVADTLARMIAAGEFPRAGAPTGQRRGAPRVGDGVICLDVEGVITYATPNAISALHRLGHHGDIAGASLSKVVTDLLHDTTVADESLPLVVTGRAPWRSEVEANGASLTMRAIPLTEGGARTGALILLRDVSELRRRERELLTKDATIREIHHRVKNNLQTVAALLRLQSRRVTDELAREALQEAVRRVATIALVHDTLSRTLDEEVDFDGIVTRALTSIVEVAASGAQAGGGSGITWELRGSFGRVVAEDATSMAMIVTELVHNAVEHGLQDGPGHVIIEAHRGEGDAAGVVDPVGVGGAAAAGGVGAAASSTADGSAAPSAGSAASAGSAPSAGSVASPESTAGGSEGDGGSGEYSSGASGGNSESGRPYRSAGTEPRVSPSDRLTVRVIDNGRGLPEGFRPGQSGLGTQIVSALVQDLRGRIDWSSDGTGTTVSFVARLRHTTGDGERDDERSDI